MGCFVKVFLLMGLLLAAATIVLSACDHEIEGRPYKYKPLDVKIDGLEMFKTCNKKDAELPPVSNETLAKKIVVEDTIETMDIETVDCNGKVISKTHGPSQDLRQFIMVEPPANMSESVNYVSVENFRSCAVHTFDVQKELGKYSSVLHNGRMIVELSDSPTKFNSYLNLKEGNNVLSFRYFGKCLTPKEKKFPFASEESFLNCEQGKEIASQDLLLELKINRPDVGGKKQITKCEKK